MQPQDPNPDPSINNVGAPGTIQSVKPVVGGEIQPSAEPVTVVQSTMPPSFGSNPNPSLDSAGPTKPKGSLFSKLSLILPTVAIALYILVIFVNSLISSETMVFVWFFIFLLLGVTGLTLGLLNLKKSDKLQLSPLMGIILSTIISLSVFFVGIYYVKLMSTINSIQNSVQNSVDSSNFDFNE